MHRFEMHKVDGVSHKVEGKARLLPDGRAQVVVRAPVESFDSGNVNRDAHMKETVEAAKYPFIELKAMADGVAAPATVPSTVHKTFKAQLTFHGVQQTFELPMEVVGESIERPSLLFVKVDDDVKIDAEVSFE